MGTGKTYYGAVQEAKRVSMRHYGYWWVVRNPKGTYEVWAHRQDERVGYETVAAYMNGQKQPIDEG